MKNIEGNTNLNLDSFFNNADETQLSNFIERAREQKRKSLDRRVAELEDWKIKEIARRKIVENDIVVLKEQNKILLDEVEEVKKETGKVTNTLIIHGVERRELEKYIHRIIYKEISKDSLRDKLFHGILTRNCKAHLSQSLTVPSFNWINVTDVIIAKSLSMKYLNKTTIHNLMQKKALEIQKRFNPVKGNKKQKFFTDAEIKQNNALEILIDECGGDINEI